MQNLLSTVAPVALPSLVSPNPATPAPEATTTEAASKPAKPHRVKAAKPATPATVVAPAAAPAETTDRIAERIAAREAISAYYGAGSIPFKAASDTFAPFRTDKAPKNATTRQAALLAAMLISGDNVAPNGDFKRGGFTHNGKPVQPETGCLSDMHGRVITHVSGPLAGKLARDAVFNIDLAKAKAEISANLGDALGKLALARINTLQRKQAKAA
jgi:hypothetical protein